MGLFSGELTFGGAHYWRNFAFQNGLDNKNGLKHEDNSPKQLQTANPNSPWAYMREGLLSEGYLGLIFGRAYFRNLQYMATDVKSVS